MDTATGEDVIRTLDLEQSGSEKQNNIYIGLKISAYAELTEFVKKYEIDNKQKFYKKRSRRITAAKKNLKRELKASLEFYEIEFECVHGKERSKRGNGLRQTSTLRLGCDAHFKLRVCSTGQYLKVYAANLNHTNHDLSTNVFEHLYQNRELNEGDLENVCTYLELDANKKKIQNKILLETGKKTTLKDLHNIHYRKIKIGKNDLEEAVNLLKTKYCCNVHILCDEETNFKALQFTTENMRNAMSAWPEFICVDGTYKLLDIGCTVFLILVEDSNGQAEIVNVSLLSVEDKDTYHWIFETFKTEMDTSKIMCFMGDKDLTERNVIKELFPNTPFYLCLFHTLKTFRREINCDKLGITKAERDLSLEYLQKLVYSNNETEYDKLYAQFKECVPKSVFTYFDNNWHNIRNEWLVCNMTYGNLKNTTNNRMESINHKIKQVVPKNSTLIDFIKNFFIFLGSHNQERDAKAANHILKKPHQQFEHHAADMTLYSDFLTNYSFRYIQKQINLMEKVKIITEVDNGEFEILSSRGKISVTTENCQCGHFSSMMLPCQHIFVVRERKKMSLFSKNLCHLRWTKEYYLSKQRIGVVNSNIVTEPVCAVSRKQKIMTLTEKRKAATLVTNSLVDLLSFSSNSDFSYKLDQLKKLEHCWKIGKEVSLEAVNSAEVNGEVDSCNVVTENENYDILNRITSPNEDEDERYMINTGGGLNIPDIPLPEFATNAKTMGNKSISDTQICCNSEQHEFQILFDGNVDELDVTLESSAENNDTPITNLLLVNPETIKLAEESVNDGNNNYEQVSIENITLPPKIKKRGRPKGHDTTVIGLKKKRNRTIPKKFILQSKPQQIFYILSTILKEDIMLTYDSIEDQTFKISDTDNIKDQLPDVLLDPAVILDDFKNYFTIDAWEFFLIKLSDKKVENEWLCRMCSQSLAQEPSIVCECCLYWYHLKCSALTKVPKIKTWFCRFCYNLE